METTVWYCDTCSKEITNSKKALVVWTTGDDLMKSNFRIIHKGPACDLVRLDDSMELDHMTDASGMQHLLSFLSRGAFHNDPGYVRIKDFDEYVDIFRRLQTPGYEEARRHYSDGRVQEEFGSTNEVAPYTEDYMRSIVKLGSES